ncbi:MAG TPA: hypothetical protein VFR85_01470 [Anaeromyxobacteraceae bacterium]|nr:hypothetical protein [Anaeromyxobacteraceae bacterium]
MAAALAAGCGGLADGDYGGEPLAVIQGTLAPPSGQVRVAGELSLALLWAPAADHGALLNLLGAASGPAVDASYTEACIDVAPRTEPLCDGTPARGDRRCDWTDRRLGSLLRVVDYQAHLPGGFEIAIRELPPEAARYDLSRQGGFGSFALASVVAFDDVNLDGAFRLGRPGSPPEPTLAMSGHQTYDPDPDRPRRSYLVAYLAGLIDHQQIDPAYAEVLLFLPQGFSVWVEDEWLDGDGRTTASGRLWQPIEVPVELRMPTQAVVGCEQGTRETIYRPAIPEGEKPSWCSDDRFRATWSKTTTDVCDTVEERYSGDFSCAGSLVPPAWACPAPTTGSLLVSVVTTGQDPDPDGYVLRIDGGVPLPVQPNDSVAVPVLTPGTHTVAIEGLAANCAVAGVSTVQVAVAAGETALAAFTVECWQSGTIRVVVSSTGLDLDPDGYTVGLEGGAPRAIGNDGTVTLPGVRPGTYLVSLSGLATNCGVVGANPLSIEVLSGVTADARFAVACGGRVGDVRVTTTTTGFDLDADGYVATLDDGNCDWDACYWVQRPIAASGSVLFPGVPEGAFRISLGGLARNCSSSSPNPQWLTVAYGQTTDVAFAVECVATGGLTVTTTTSGVDLDPDGYSVVWSGAGQSETAAAPLNGTTTFFGLVPGSYQVALRGVAPNCDGRRQVAVAVVAGVSTSVLLDIVCAPDRPLAFVDFDYTNFSHEIYVIRSNGAGLTRLTANSAQDFEPAWSPDGTTLAFKSDRDGNEEIYVMQADGSSPRRLTNQTARDYSPTWSPDGTRIAFVSERDGNAEIYVMAADGSNPTRLTNDPVRQDSDPAWSPDGTRIAFAKGVPGAFFTDPMRICTMNTDGSNVTCLSVFGSGAPEEDQQPAWSPDGTRLAFARTDREYYSALMVMNADGTGATALTDGWIDTDPAWSPDGRTIAFVRSNYWLDGISVQAIRADGTESVEVVGLSSAAGHPTWRP